MHIVKAHRGSERGGGGVGRSADERFAVVRHETIEGFEEVAGNFLLAREAEHNQLLGLLSELRDGLWELETAYLGSVHDRQATVGVGMQTPPHNLILSCLEQEGALQALVADVETTTVDLPGVLGPAETSAALARLRSQGTGSTTSPGIRMRIHRADAIDVPAGIQDACATRRMRTSTTSSRERSRSSGRRRVSASEPTTPRNCSTGCSDGARGGSCCGRWTGRR
jgi:hypothetical protein